MAKYLLTILAMICAVQAFAQKDVQAIKDVLEQQRQAWNRGSVEEYMQGYWNNDSLLFIGKSGPTYGYQQTLERYKKSYSDTAKMGQLRFEVLQIKKLSGEYYFVLGKWFLKRTVGDLNGSFTLIFRKIHSKWYIVADHSS
jgi:ketosteroid isomerase-like protein